MPCCSEPHAAITVQSCSFLAGTSLQLFVKLLESRFVGLVRGKLMRDNGFTQVHFGWRVGSGGGDVLDVGAMIHVGAKRVW